MPHSLPLRAILFDFDGTLAPSLPLWVRAYRIALAQLGYELTDDEIRRRCMFRDWSVVAQAFGTFTGEQIREQVDIGLKKAFADAILFPLAQPLIEHCRSHDVQVALVTSAPRHLIVDVLGRLLVHQLFDFIICGDEVPNYKPHPEPVLTALTALQRQPQEAIMVGDSHVDILAGKAAGTRTALYLPEGDSPFHDVVRLRATEPDHIFQDHAELAALLGLPQLAR
jgi:HAD superfamily hydrolase (TIGR01509 family)